MQRRSFCPRDIAPAAWDWRDDFLDQLFDRRGIADLLRLFALIDGAKVFAALKRGVEKSLKLLAGKIAALDQIRRLHQSLQGDRRLFQIQTLGFETAHQLA